MLCGPPSTLTRRTLAINPGSPSAVAVIGRIRSAVPATSVRWSCRTGVCHSCETTLIAGGVDYDPDPVEPPAAGSALICCSRPHDAVVLDL